MWCVLGVQNGLIGFPLFLMGKFDSTYKDFDLRVASRNGLPSYLEYLLCVCVCVCVHWFSFIMGTKICIHSHVMGTSCGMGTKKQVPIREMVIKQYRRCSTCVSEVFSVGPKLMIFDHWVCVNGAQQRPLHSFSCSCTHCSTHTFA